MFTVLRWTISEIVQWSWIFGMQKFQCGKVSQSVNQSISLVRSGSFWLHHFMSWKMLSDTDDIILLNYRLGPSFSGFYFANYLIATLEIVPELIKLIPSLKFSIFIATGVVKKFFDTSRMNQVIATCAFYTNRMYECYGVADCSTGNQGILTCVGAAPWRGAYDGSPSQGKVFSFHISS